MNSDCGAYVREKHRRGFHPSALPPPVASAAVVPMPPETSMVAVAEVMPVKAVMVPSTAASIIEPKAELHGRTNINWRVVHWCRHDISRRHGIWLAVVRRRVIVSVRLVVCRNDDAPGQSRSEDNESE